MAVIPQGTTSPIRVLLSQVPFHSNLQHGTFVDYLTLFPTIIYYFYFASFISLEILENRNDVSK